MSPFTLFLLSAVGFMSASVLQQWRSGGMDDIPARLKSYSGFGIIAAGLWAASKTEFWRSVFIVVWALIFATLMLPEEMGFFARHPSLVLALPAAAGFVAANYHRSGIGALSSIVVVAVLALAIYRFMDEDRITGPWLRAHETIITGDNTYK
jgi:hypothetical protein